MTNETYITGHRNPDLDSLCSALSYAELKNRTENDGVVYKAVRCGHLSDVIKKQFAFLGIDPPPYMRDVTTKVRDVMSLPTERIEASEPIYNLVKAYNSSHSSVYPIFSGESFRGLLSIDDIASWFLKDNREEVPAYLFSLDNIARVLPGRFVRKGKPSFVASILAGAAAYGEFEKIVTPSMDALIVLGARERHIARAAAMNVPALVITTSSDAPKVDFSQYKGSVYITEIGTSEAIRRLRMAPAIETLLSAEGPRLDADDTYDEAKEILSSSFLRGLSVYEGDEWKGYVTSRSFLHKPRRSVILVDHNEAAQSIKGVEEAEVKEILDHHRLDALKTSVPLFIDSEPLGSTCTIVYQQYLRHNAMPGEKEAKALLAGIISDTMILRSPTTTAVDRAAAGALAAVSGEYDIQSFGEKLFSFTDPLSKKDPDEAIRSDFKVYREKGAKIGIGQAEVMTLKDSAEYAGRYLEALERTAESENLDWAMLLVTDVIRERSILLSRGGKWEKRLPWNEISPGVFDLPGVMSRKKQLLPEVIYSLD